MKIEAIYLRESQERYKEDVGKRKEKGQFLGKTGSETEDLERVCRG